MIDEQNGFTVFRVPRSHWHCYLWDFQWDRVKPATLQQHVTAFLHAVQDTKAPHLVLMGPPGIGKTHIGLGLYRVASAVWGTEQCMWLNVPAFLESVKRSYDDPTIDPWDEVEAATRLVVMDDMFARQSSQHDGQLLYRLIDTAYSNNAAIVVTSNTKLADLTRMLPPHEISRLLDNSTRFELTAPDARLQ